MDEDELERARKVVAEGVFAGPAPLAVPNLTVALWHVETWWWATWLQHNRLAETSSPTHAMAEVSLLVLALRNLLRAAHLAARVCPDERIPAAIELFEKRLPGLVEIRAVLEHFDEYAEGVGRFQRSAAEPGEQIPRMAIPPGDFLLKVGRHVLMAGVTGAAAEDLAKDVLGALNEHLERSSR